MEASKKLKMLLLCMSLGLGTSACSTTNMKVDRQAAPISYKLDQASLTSSATTEQYASLGGYMAGSSGVYSNAPVQTAPQMATPSFTSPNFDKSTVDRQLYKHQRVGKPYKIAGKKYTPKHEPDYDQTGVASWYGPKFNGKPTASGEIFNKEDMTAAHTTLPLNSMVHVTNLATGQSLMLRINDRGPFVGDRIIDLSEAAARRLGTISNGLARVRVQYAGPAEAAGASQIYQAPQRAALPMPVAPQPIPQIPAPVPSAPAAVAPAPQGYTPLRELAQPTQRPAAPLVPQMQSTPAPSSVAAMPTPAPVYALPQVDAPIPAPMAAPVERDRLAPVAPPRPEQGGQITLTIKGPIHMANSSSDDFEANLIPAVHRTTRPSK